MPTPQEILGTFPDFATPSSPYAQSIWVELADKQTAAVAVWGDDEDIRNLAVALLAAHMMAKGGLVAPSATTGGIKSESIGSASITYADPAASIVAASGDLGTTSYGQQLMQLRAMYIFAPHVSGE